MFYVRSRVRTRTHGSVGRRRLRPPLTRYEGIVPTNYKSVPPKVGSQLLLAKDLRKQGRLIFFQLVNAHFGYVKNLFENPVHHRNQLAEFVSIMM